MFKLILALLLTGQEPVVQPNHAQAVSPTTESYSGDCGGRFEVSIRRSVTSDQSRFQTDDIEVTRGGRTTSLSGSKVFNDLNREGLYYRNAFSCGGNQRYVNWYIWIVRLEAGSEPEYLVGRVDLGEDGEIVRYDGLGSADRDYLAVKN